ncbi:type III-B CRISPR module RAMP protein Cmr6 [Aeromonas sanarellii]|uniref:type III-B CRISPR module RAMP protein Cmr6 n=1 Tax=Aeromonas sanarellii TaxID=633415 RepID=UPI002DBB473A|nr:type III-B CRISPR module RAMP protein Cmr6 [Aeromonas sanarellii]MEB6605840.1 type III-B CRISPR module RAMP protein Cmr6 [Aeromonas sanarellii]
MAEYLQRVPLYQSALHTKEQIDLLGPHTNKGLIFERLFGGYDQSWKVDKLQRDKVKQTHPLDWLTGPCGNAAALETAKARQLALISALDGAAISCELDWNMVTGTGEAHPLENGFRWHHTLGVPYLPASSIKGMLRAWLTTWANDIFSKEEIIGLFGSDQETNDAHQMGALIFFDALPLTPATLTLDVMTPHAGDWYEKGASQPGKPDTVPADWQSPVPITFLAVKEATLLFTLAARNDASQSQLGKVMEQLADALAMLGIGAKTALGYGVMTKLETTQPQSGERLLGELQEKRRQQQADRKRQLERASMSPNQLSVAELADRLGVREDKQFKEGFNNEIADLVNTALRDSWSADERFALATLIEQRSVWTQISKKEKARERKSLLAQLKG